VPSNLAQPDFELVPYFIQSSELVDYLEYCFHFRLSLFPGMHLQFILWHWPTASLKYRFAPSEDLLHFSYRIARLLPYHFCHLIHRLVEFLPHCISLYNLLALFIAC